MTRQKADTPEPADLPEPEAPDVTQRKPPVPKELPQDDPLPGGIR